jgi:two-component system invasion response regulator UvrY
MMLFLYSLLVRAMVPLLRRKLALRARHEPVYGQWIEERFGAYEGIAQPGALWVHAVSLGETRVAAVLIDALRMVARHQRFIDPIIAQRMANQRTDSDTQYIDKLSPREFEVFILLAKGKSVVDISQSLGLSASTVGTHLYKVKLKLQLSNQSEMTLLAMRHGLLDETAP